MLRLTINGKDAALSTDTEISITTNSPLLDPENDDASYPFSLPLAANRHIFGDMERPNVVFDTQYDAVLYFGAHELLVGFGFISEVTRTSVEFFIKTSGKAFMGKYGSTFLDQLELGSFPATYGTLEALSAQTYLAGSELPFVFAPVTDPSLGAEDGAMPRLGQINRFSLDTGKLYGADVYHHTCPFLFLKSFLRTLFEAYSYRIIRDQSVEIAGFDRIYILCINPENRYSPVYGQTLEYSKMLPHVTVTTFFEELARKFNLRFIFDDNRKTVMIRWAAKFLMDGVVDMTARSTDSLRKIISELEVLPDNRRFFDKVIGLSDGTDSYDPTVMGAIKPYMEYNTDGTVTEDMETQAVECLSRTVLKESTTATIGNWGGTPISLPYKPVTINSAKAVTSDLIFAIFNPIDPGLLRYRINEFNSYAQPGGYQDPNDWSLYFRFPESTNGEASLSLLWSDYQDYPGLYARFFEEYYGVMDTSVESHEVELIPSVEVIGLVRELFFRNVVVKGRRYLTKKLELTFSVSGLKFCQGEFMPIG